jgi:hypothetical protein
VESNWRLTNLDEAGNRCRKMFSFLPGHGESNCRVTNPDYVTDRKWRENAKRFLPGHGEGNWPIAACPT